MQESALGFSATPGRARTITSHAPAGDTCIDEAMEATELWVMPESTELWVMPEDVC